MKNLRTSVQWCGLAVVLLAWASGATAQPKTSADTSSHPIGKYVNEFSPRQVQKTDAGYQYWFVDKILAEGKTLKMSVVKPHSATHAPHAHPEDEFFFVLEGKIEFYLDGQRKVVGPYASLYCPPNVEHGIRNVGETEAKYLVFKKYE